MKKGPCIKQRPSDSISTKRLNYPPKLSYISYAQYNNKLIIKGKSTMLKDAGNKLVTKQQ